VDNKKRIIDPLSWLVEAVQLLGFSSIFGRYFGLYRGIVIDNEDDENRGRVRVQVPAAGQITEDDVPPDLYALPCGNGLSVGASGKVHGLFFPPEVGDQVWVMFEKGIAAKPVYMGGWIHQDPETNEFEGNPKFRGFRTESGSVLKFNDEDGSITIAKGDGSGESTSAMIALTAAGELILSTTGGSQIYLNNDGGEITFIAADGSLLSIGNGTAQLINASGAVIAADGDEITLSSPGNINMVAGGKITLQGAVDLGMGPVYEAVVTGESFAATVFAPHTHLITAPTPGSPVTPPVSPPPVPGNGLSLSVRVSKT